MMAQLCQPLGPSGSGAARYAAAMYFYAQGRMPAPMLEIYRRCIHLDAEDPVDLAAFEGIAVPEILQDKPDSERHAKP